MFLIILSSMLALCMCIALGLVVYYFGGFSMFTSFFGGWGPVPMAGPGQYLPLPPLTKKSGGPWFVRTLRNETFMSIQGDTLRYNFKKGAVGNSSGPAIFANPFQSCPAESATLSFNAWFPAGYFVKAGKLLGLSIADAPGNHASGGEWSDDGASCRFMWRDPENGSAILKAYVYLAVKGGPSKAYDVQGPSTKSSMTADERTGYNLFYKKNGGMRVYENRWNSLSMTVSMNTPGKANGKLSMTCNGVNRQVNDIYWRDSGVVKVQEVYLTSIFGGSDSSFASKVDTYSLFKDFRFSAVK